MVSPKQRKSSYCFANATITKFLCVAKLWRFQLLTYFVEPHFIIIKKVECKKLEIKLKRT